MGGQIKMKKCAVIFLSALTALSLVSCSIEDIPQKGNQDFKIYKADTADPLNGFRIDDTENRLLPSIMDHSDKMPVAKDQGQTGS